MSTFPGFPGCASAQPAEALPTLSRAHATPARPSDGPGSPAWLERETQLQSAIGGMVRRDEAALRTFYEATASRVYGLALRITRSPASAEDVVADVFHQVWRDAARFDAARGAVLSWLLTLCRSRAIDHLRRRDEAELHEDPESLAAGDPDHNDDPQNLLLAIERDSTLHRALEDLTPIQRQLVALAFFRGLSHQEIADHAGMALGTVKTHIRKALEALRAVLALESATQMKP